MVRDQGFLTFVPDFLRCRARRARMTPTTRRIPPSRTSASGSVQEPAITGALNSSPRDSRARPHRIIQAGTLVWSRVRQDRPHEEDGRGQQERQRLNGSHDRPSRSRASAASALTPGVETNMLEGAWSECLRGRACRSGRSALSAPPEEPHHDKWPHRDHQARCRAGHSVSNVTGHGPDQRSEHECRLHDDHAPRQSKPRSKQVASISWRLA